MTAIEPPTVTPERPAGVPDCAVFAASFSVPARIAILFGSAAVGLAGGLGLSAGGEGRAAIWPLLGATAVLGGILSTWSPCGYSSISLLRQTGNRPGRLLAWLPTYLTHGLGYAIGAVILGALLGVIGAVAGFGGFGPSALVALALTALVYGAHQLDFLRVPYPQRRAQVPHDARARFSKPVVGLIYGLALGLDYLTYVQTPILYLITLAAVLTGNIPAAIALIALFNLGRFAPMAVNALPISDYTIQHWLARNQERAAMADGAILVAVGAALAVAALI